MTPSVVAGLNDRALGKNDMSILTISFALTGEQSFESQAQCASIEPA
jgi:hypothetical protein